jgi:integrase
LAQRQHQDARHPQPVQSLHFSLLRVGNTNEKVDVDPAKKARPRPEEEGRQRYYSRDEYNRLLEVIQRRFPEHVAEFIVSVHTGMRLGEQYTITWSQVHVDRREITLVDSMQKSGARRANPPPRNRGLDIIEQRHKAEIHMKLLMAMKEGHAGVLGHKVDLRRLLIPAEHE